MGWHMSYKGWDSCSVFICVRGIGIIRIVTINPFYYDCIPNFRKLSYERKWAFGLIVISFELSNRGEPRNVYNNYR